MGEDVPEHSEVPESGLAGSSFIWRNAAILGVVSSFPKKRIGMEDWDFPALRETKSRGKGESERPAGLMQSA